jgi:hypothetical protein
MSRAPARRPTSPPATRATRPRLDATRPAAVLIPGGPELVLTAPALAALARRKTLVLAAVLDVLDDPEAFGLVLHRGPDRATLDVAARQVTA